MSPRTDESIGITFSEERSDDPSEQTLLGLLVTYTDPYEQAGLGMIGLYVEMQFAAGRSLRWEPSAG